MNDYNDNSNDATRPGPDGLLWMGVALGRARFVVLAAVVAVMLVAITLFLIGTIFAVSIVWHSWEKVFTGQLDTVDLTVDFLEIVSIMLKAVVFYLISVGLFSLFIAPLNVTVALGVETLSDLESKVLSVIVVIMSTTFLEHFIQWKKPMETLQNGAAMALVVGSLVVFQSLAHRVKEDKASHNPDIQARAQQELFQTDSEHHEIKPDEVSGPKNENADEAKK